MIKSTNLRGIQYFDAVSYNTYCALRTMDSKIWFRLLIINQVEFQLTKTSKVHDLEQIISEKYSYYFLCS